MSASAIDFRSIGENRYETLRLDFDAAYKKMMDSSREFTAILMYPSPGLSPEERRERKDSAALVYEEANERFMAAVARLNEFMISQSIASRSQLQPVASRR
jgi:hypothetical protein